MVDNNEKEAQNTQGSAVTRQNCQPCLAEMAAQMEA